MGSEMCIRDRSENCPGFSTNTSRCLRIVVQATLYLDSATLRLVLVVLMPFMAAVTLSVFQALREERDSFNQFFPVNVFKSSRSSVSAQTCSRESSRKLMSGKSLLQFVKELIRTCSAQHVRLTEAATKSAAQAWFCTCKQSR